MSDHYEPHIEQLVAQLERLVHELDRVTCEVKTNIKNTKIMVDKCTWKHDTDYKYYDTSCGEKLTFDADWDEAEDLVKFCWHCGKPTEFVFWLRCKNCDDKLEWGYRGKYCSLCEPEHESDLEVENDKQ